MFAFDVVEARFVRDRVVWLRFRDGTSGEVDLAPELWGEAFAPLQDTAYFRRFRVEGNTLVWPNDVDLAAEFLHEQVRISTRS